MRDERKTWRSLISEELKEHGESWGDILAITLSKEELDVKFDAGYGGTEGKSFTAWTEKRVYFPAEYDGSEWCASVSRIIDLAPTRHV